MAPEDRPEVNGLDAGWVSRRSEVTLHVASAVVGRLGGAASPLPPATGPYIVSVWSRHVTGADHLKAEVARFFDHRLPTVSAADVEPHNYATFREEREHGDEVLTWMRTLGDDALRYQRAGQEVVDVSEAALPGEGRVGRSDIRAADSAGSRPPGSPQMVEEQAIKRIDETLRTESRSAGALLPAGVWRSVVLTLAATIDGGPLPVGSPGSWAHGHRLVVDPRIMWPDAELPEHEYSEEATRILPELDHCPPERIAASAVRSVVAELRDEDGTVPGVPFPALGSLPAAGTASLSRARPLPICTCRSHSATNSVGSASTSRENRCRSRTDSCVTCSPMRSGHGSMQSVGTRRRWRRGPRLPPRTGVNGCSQRWQPSWRSSGPCGFSIRSP